MLSFFLRPIHDEHLLCPRVRIRLLSPPKQWEININVRKETKLLVMLKERILCYCVVFGLVVCIITHLLQIQKRKHANENDKIVIAIMAVVDSSICVRASYHSSS